LEPHEPVARLLAGLRPAGLYFATTTALAGLVFYAYAGVEREDWPCPAVLVCYLWLAVAVCAVPYMALSAVAAYLVARQVPETTPARQATPPTAGGEGGDLPSQPPR
jgi:hypothetical protein